MNKGVIQVSLKSPHHLTNPVKWPTHCSSIAVFLYAYFLQILKCLFRKAELKLEKLIKKNKKVFTPTWGGFWLYWQRVDALNRMWKHLWWINSDVANSRSAVSTVDIFPGIALIYLFVSGWHETWPKLAWNIKTQLKLVHLKQNLEKRSLFISRRWVRWPRQFLMADYSHATPNNTMLCTNKCPHSFFFDRKVGSTWS